MQSVFQKYIGFFAVLLLCTFGVNSVYAADTYDATTGRLTIPLVRAYGNVYRDVVIQIGDILAVKGGAAADTLDSYDSITNQLSIPSVTAFGTTYTNVVIKVGAVVGIGGMVSNISSLSYENRHKDFSYSMTLPIFPNARALFKYANGDLGYVAVTLTNGPWNATLENALPSLVHFYKQVNGQWIENADVAFDATNSAPGCQHPRKAIAADYNQDGVIDFAIACHGWDAPPYAGERSRVLLSQPGGKYRLDYLSSTVGFQHGGASADINGDGFPDLVLTNNNGVDVFINDRTGHFVRSADLTIPQQRRAFHVELLDLNGDGKYDMVAGSHEWDDATRIILNPGDNNFGGSLSNRPPEILIPAVPGAGVITDFLYVKSINALYIVRTGDGKSNGTVFYEGLWVQKFDLTTRISTVVYANATWFNPEHTRDKWIDWVVEKDGKLTRDYGTMFQLQIQ